MLCRYSFIGKRGPLRPFRCVNEPPAVISTQLPPKVMILLIIAIHLPDLANCYSSLECTLTMIGVRSDVFEYQCLDI